MAGKIFLNYRRGDDAGTVGRLFDRLEQAFAKEHLFMDVEGHIKAGDDYVDTLHDQVAQCDVLLAAAAKERLRELKGRGFNRRAVLKGETVVSGGRDMTIKVWNIA